MEKIKREVIKLLTDNARYTDKEISAMLGEKESDIRDIRIELEQQGVIVKYSAIINNELATKRTVEAMIEVKVAPQKLKGFDSYAEELYNFSEVKSLYLTSGGFDLAVFVEGKELADIAKFVAEKLSIIDGITSVQTHFILKKYKIEGQITHVDNNEKRQIIQA